MTISIEPKMHTIEDWRVIRLAINETKRKGVLSFSSLDWERVIVLHDDAWVIQAIGYLGHNHDRMHMQVDLTKLQPMSI